MSPALIGTAIASLDHIIKALRRGDTQEALRAAIADKKAFARLQRELEEEHSA